MVSCMVIVELLLCVLSLSNAVQKVARLSFGFRRGASPQVISDKKKPRTGERGF